MGEWKGMDPWLALGASLYWASYAFRITDAAPVYAAAIGPAWPVVANVFMLIWVIGCYLVCRWHGVDSARTPVALATAVASAVVLACDLACDALGLVPAVIVCCLDYFTLGACMVLWGLAFASLEKRLAAVNVTSAVLVAVVLVLAGMACADVARLAWLTNGCTIASAAIMLSGRVVLRNRARHSLPRPRLTLGALAAQRVAYGVALGFYPILVARCASLQMDGVLLAFTLVGLAVAGIAALRSDLPLYTILPALVLVAAVALCLPFAHGGVPSILPALLINAWLAWQTLSSVQLSDLKERFGLSELGISLVDKTAIAVTTLTGSALFQITDAAALPPETVQTSLLMVLCVLMPMAAFSLARLVGVHQEDAFSDRVTREGERRRERLFADIAEEFGLSARECEVFEMLAQGYSGAFIADEIGITHGTVKAHVAHIYHKLGVHRKDEILNLVESRANRA